MVSSHILEGAYFQKEFCVRVLDRRSSVGLIFLEGGSCNLFLEILQHTIRDVFQFPKSCLFVCFFASTFSIQRARSNMA